MKTHYRKAFNSPYLSSSDITEPIVLTIRCVKLEPDRTKKTGDSFNTAYFAEQEIRPGEKLKPMILNVHNSQILRMRTGSHFLEDWNDIPVTIYVDSQVRFGRETVEGLRINPEPPKPKKELKPNTQAWQNAIKALKRDKNLNAVKKHMTISKENEKLLKEQANAVS